jgi:hypothetical protein
MAETLRVEKSPLSREMGFGRQVLRLVLGLIFAAVTVVLVWQGVSLRHAVQWAVYLVLFVATDQIANAIMNRLSREHEQTRNGRKDSASS